MVLPVALIDHVIVNTLDRLDDAAALWTRLGFLLTPRGHHTLGSSNNLIVFGTDYIELLGVMPGGPQRTDVLDWPPGLNGIAFVTHDSDGLHATLTAAEMPILPPQAFSRPVDLGDGRTLKASFRIVRLERGAVPAGRIFFCHHLSPELVWHDPWRRHPNGALGIAGVVVSADDPSQLGDLFGRMFGPDAIRCGPQGITLPAGLATLDVMRPDVVQARFEETLPDLSARSQVMAALVIRTGSLIRTAAALREGGITGHSDPRRIVVPAAEAGGVTLVFEE